MLSSLLSYHVSAQLNDCSNLPPNFICAGGFFLDTLDLSAASVGGPEDLINFSPDCGLWQRGSNQKIEFGSPGADYGIITDSALAYPANSNCSFELSIPDASQNLSFLLYFEHRFLTDSLTDGGYIEYSCNRQQWNKLVNNQNFGFPVQTNFHNFPGIVPFNSPDISSLPRINDSTYAFTGNGNQWQWSGVQIVWAFPVKLEENMASSGCDILPNDSLHLRFVFESDANAENLPGWMIRKIAHGWVDLGSGMEAMNNDSYVFYPNPAKDYITTQADETLILDLNGTTAMQHMGRGKIDISKLAAGFYTATCRFGNTFKNLKLIKL